MNIFSFYLILLLIKTSSSKNKIYKIKFGLYNQKKSDSEQNIVNNIFFNCIYLNLSLGTPSQIIPFELDSNSQTFSASTEYFNQSLSSTYEQLSDKLEYYVYEVVSDGFDSKDILNINGEIGEKINFILSKKYIFLKKNNLGISYILL